jgi:hypothetical protein
VLAPAGLVSAVVGDASAVEDPLRSLGDVDLG